MGNEWIIAIILVVSYFMSIRLTRLARDSEIDRLASVAKIDELLSLANRQDRQIDELNSKMTLLQDQIDSLD
jgi:peptidoglycan hydrolase CwlO-like protein